MKNIELVRAHLNDNTGDENISKLIWIVIVFVVGALLLATLTTAFDGGVIDTWLDTSLNTWFPAAGESRS